MIVSFFIDFGKKETSLLQELWHEKVSKLLKDLKNKKPENDEDISCDTPRYWFDEGITLDLVKDPTFDQLNDLVDDVDTIQKASRFC